MTRFRYLWRLYLGWFPIQPCLGCWRWYWGGFPDRGWEASYKEYCSKQCNDWNEWGEGAPRC